VSCLDVAQIKLKTKFPLHTAIRFGREDIIFLYMIDHDSDMAARINEVDALCFSNFQLDETSSLPLHLAIVDGHEGIANTLVRRAWTSA
jgi:ankyrin repeat protein